MRTFILLFSMTLLGFTPNSIVSQNSKIKIEEDVTLSIDKIFNIIEEQTDYRFIYQKGFFDGLPDVPLKKGTIKVNKLLEKSLSYGNFKAQLTANNTIIVKKQNTITQQRIVTGNVVDESGTPLTGVTVLVKGTKQGVITDENGAYTINAPSNGTLVFSYIGMKTQEIAINSKESIDVTLVEDIEELEALVVTSFVTRNRESFTGVATTLKGEEILKVSNTDILRAIAILDPGVVVNRNVDQGSNPNALPEIIIRGTTSINTEGQFGVNIPLIVIDGVESTLRALYDIDLFEIEAVTILKDASATALYGERASNGVILVKRKANSQKELRTTYNFTGRVDVADLSDYNLMNAAQKLELERLSGLYDSQTGNLDQLYNDRLALVNSGVNTNWIAKPVRSSFSQNHSLRVSGRASGMDFGLTGRYRNNQGVMKDDYRRTYGIGLNLQYNHNDKLIVSFRGDLWQTNVQNSKYGNFSDYIQANPYDAPYNQDGILNRNLSYNRNNPLYEASLSSFSESLEKVISANLNLRWNIKPGFYATGRATINSNEGRGDIFISPESNQFAGIDSNNKGSYDINTNKSSEYILNTTFSYNKNLDEEGSLLTLNAGGELRRNKTNPYGFRAVGFFSDRTPDLSFATQFPEGSAPSGTPAESSGVAAYGAINAVYKSRYFLDGSYRTSGSSRFGANRRYAPFWSLGAGWNLHRESFLDKDWIDILRIRGSFGHTGSINFSPYQAITTYRYTSDYIYAYGNGAVPITLGNENLKWETTESSNLGLTSTFLGNRINFNFDIYKKRTFDLIVPISLTPSSGVTLVQDNVGEQENTGFEATVSGMIIKSKDIDWRLNLAFQKNRTKLVEIGNALETLNISSAADQTRLTPANLFIEGESPTMIYTVPSGGIDPATGRELFVSRNGQLTYTWNPDDKVAIGDRTPDYRGTFTSYARWKNFSLNIASSFSVGGYIYNTTRLERIERIDVSRNGDVRAFTQRWQQPGDVVQYLGINSGEIFNNNHSSRFVEKENFFAINTINLNYEFSREKIKPLGFNRLSVGLNINEPFRFSTVEIERGVSYPFSRGFTFNLSATF